MKWYHKLGWFWIAFVCWLFIMVVLMHGCTPDYSVEAEETSKLGKSTPFLPLVTYSCDLHIEYDIVYIYHGKQEEGIAVLNEKMREWSLIDVSWGTVNANMVGAYTLAKQWCE